MPSRKGNGLFDSTTTNAAGPLTQEDWDRAVRAVENDLSVDPCKLGQHLVSASEKARGYGICVNCGTPVGNWP